MQKHKFALRRNGVVTEVGNVVAADEREGIKVVLGGRKFVGRGWSVKVGATSTTFDEEDVQMLLGQIGDDKAKDDVGSKELVLSDSIARQAIAEAEQRARDALVDGVEKTIGAAPEPKVRLMGSAESVVGAPLDPGTFPADFVHAHQCDYDPHAGSKCQWCKKRLGERHAAACPKRDETVPGYDRTGKKLDPQPACSMCDDTGYRKGTGMVPEPPCAYCGAFDDLQKRRAQNGIPCGKCTIVRNGGRVDVVPCRECLERYKKAMMGAWPAAGGTCSMCGGYGLVGVSGASMPCPKCKPKISIEVQCGMCGGKYGKHIGTCPGIHRLSVSSTCADCGTEAMGMTRCRSCEMKMKYANRYRRPVGRGPGYRNPVEAACEKLGLRPGDVATIRDEPHQHRMFIYMKDGTAHAISDKELYLD